MLKICFIDRDLYGPLLKSDILNSIIIELWYCQYEWTFNFLNSSSIFKNIIIPFATEPDISNIQTIKINSTKNQRESLKSIEIGNPSSRNNINMSFNSINNSIHKSIPKNNSLKLFHNLNFEDKFQFIEKRSWEFNWKTPFEFFKSTTLDKDVRSSNHIFTLFYWQKSPAYKVLLDMSFYIFIFIWILIFIFDFYKLRNYVNEHSDIVKNFYDGISSWKLNSDTTVFFKNLLNNYFTSNKLVNSSTAIENFKKLDHIELAKLIIPNNYDEYLSFMKEYSVLQTDTINIIILSSVNFLYMFQTTFEIIIFYKKEKKFSPSLKNWIDILIINVNLSAVFYFFLKLDFKSLRFVQDSVVSRFTVIDEIFTALIFLLWMKFIAFFFFN